MTIIQIPSIILPHVWTLGTETELVNDLLEHTSIEFDVRTLQEKQVNIFAMEIVAAGVPGPLWIWVELSPVLTTTSGAYWAAISGGGGAQVPINPIIVVGTGINFTQRTLVIPWTQHSAFARVVCWTPVSVATDFWAVQCLVSGKG